MCTVHCWGCKIDIVMSHILDPANLDDTCSYYGPNPGYKQL